MSTTKIEISPLDLERAWTEEPPELDFSLPGLVRGTVGTLVATGGTGKSFLALETAIGVAVGRDVGGLWGRDPVEGGAVYVGLEDPELVMRNRLWALRDLVLPTEQRRALGRLTVLAAAGEGRAIVEARGRGLAPTRWFEALSDHLAALRPRLVVVDTLNRAIGGASENDAGPMGTVLALVEGLARRAQAAVLLSHHVSKGSAVGAGAEQAHAARGSSVITDNARWQANLSRPTRSDRRYDEVTDEELQGLLRLDVTKCSYGPTPPTRWLRRDRDGVLNACRAPAGLAETDAPARARRGRSAKARGPGAR